MDKIKDYLPLASAFFLVIGAIRLIFFYGFFGIDIISYIELAEVLGLSLSFLVNGSIISFLFFIVLIPISTDAYFLYKETDKMAGAVGILIIMSFSFYWFYSTYDIMGNYIVDFRISYDSFLVLAVYILVPVLTKYVLPSIRSRVNDTFSINLDTSNLLFLTLASSVFALCAWQARDSARDILLKRRADYVEVKLESTIIKSNQSYRFVGKTKGYVFFYDLKNNISDVYSLDGNKKMSFRNNLPSLQIGGIDYSKNKK